MRDKKGKVVRDLSKFTCSAQLQYIFNAKSCKFGFSNSISLRISASRYTAEHSDSIGFERCILSFVTISFVMVSIILPRVYPSGFPLFGSLKGGNDAIVTIYSFHLSLPISRSAQHPLNQAASASNARTSAPLIRSQSTITISPSNAGKVTLPTMFSYCGNNNPVKLMAR